MSDKPNNPNAFPESCGAEGYRGNVEPGMTLRDYFAAKVIQAILTKDPVRKSQVEQLAINSYFVADEMLKARK